MLETYEERIKKLNIIYEMYKKGLEGLENNRLLPIKINKGEIPLLIDVISQDRSKTTKILNNKNLPTCNYHESLDQQTIQTYEYLKNSRKFVLVFHPPCDQIKI